MLQYPLQPSPHLWHVSVINALEVLYCKRKKSRCLASLPLFPCVCWYISAWGYTPVNQSIKWQLYSLTAAANFTPYITKIAREPTPKTQKRAQDVDPASKIPYISIQLVSKRCTKGADKCTHVCYHQKKNNRCSPKTQVLIFFNTLHQTYSEHMTAEKWRLSR